MSTWISETEFRQSGAEAAGITINVPFLREIKTDYEFRELLNNVYHEIMHGAGNRTIRFASESGNFAQKVAERLSDLRDELETYFALEECYGYFQHSATQNPNVSRSASRLQQDHETLFLQLSEIIETTWQVVYRESSPQVEFQKIAESFDRFCENLAHHEQEEMELMMRLCNEDFGVGD
tara:strand:- start:1378 stop:1917 length:540 start_codon:yes stop_codon:yes gene_type:complete